MPKTIRTLTNIESDIRTNIAAFNEAISNEDFAAISTANAKQEELEKEYAKQAKLDCYSALREQANPMLAAITTYGYNVLRHKDVKVKSKTVIDGEEQIIITTVRELTVREKQIDLIEFDNFGGKTVSINPSWKYELQSLNQLFCIRTAQDLNVKFTPVSYYMDKMARRIEDGETPVSNTSMLEALQNLIDMVLYEQKEDKEENKYRANSRDITALVKQYTKAGKARLGIAVAKHNYFASLIGKVLYRIATGEQYTLEYKISKDK